ncbi:MAG TPA: FG-GAP-like repeat-containing protein [Bacteroidia bacterium]|nr:FG-GAP-like repeat-containing protein [Bacteroidia bacterium]
MKKVVAFLLTLCPFLVISQQPLNFRLADSIPVTEASHALLFPWAGGINFPRFSEIDLNSDGLKDLFVFDMSNNRVMTFVNTGTGGTNSYRYSPEYAAQFPEMRGWAILYDYNCDGKEDLFTVPLSNNGIMQYRNDSQPGQLIFTLVENQIKADYGGGSISNILASGFLIPDLNDIDGDGDMDILGQQFFCVGSFAYYKNMSMEQFGVCDSINKYVLETNAWGHFALRSGSYPNVAVSTFNSGCTIMNAVPEEFMEQTIARRDDTYAQACTIDIDGDGDKDVLIGDSQAVNTLLIVNGGTANAAQMVSQDTLFPSYNTPAILSSFTSPAHVDADHDGVKDLLVSNREFENKQGVLYYRNTGTNTVPVFNYQQNQFLQGEMIDLGEGAAPVFFDADADGLKDLIIGYKSLSVGGGNVESGLAYYRNTGTLAAPAFEFVTRNYAGVVPLSLNGPLLPAFGDLDGDQDDDLLIGSDDGQLYYFNNTAGQGQPAQFTYTAAAYMGIDVGNVSTPQLADLNRDGKIDLLIGEKNGFLNYYENIGTSVAPFFSNLPTIDTLGGIIVQTAGFPDGYSSPFLFDDNGSYRLIVSCMQGKVFAYSNIDGNLNGTFTLEDTLLSQIQGNKYSFLMTVSGADLNEDGFVDLVYGLYGGGAQIFLQTDPSAGVQEMHIANSIEVYPVPASDVLVLKWKDQLRHTATPFTIKDMYGRTITSIVLSGRETRIDVSGFSAGLYFIGSVQSGRFAATKFLVLH